MTDKAMMTVDEVAELCGVARESVRYLIKERGLPATKTAPHRTAPVVFDRAKVEAWLKSNPVHGRRPGAKRSRPARSVATARPSAIAPAIKLAPEGDPALGLRLLLLAWVRAAVGDEFQEEIPGLVDLDSKAFNRLEALIGVPASEVGQQWVDVRAYLLTRVNPTPAAAPTLRLVTVDDLEALMDRDADEVGADWRPVREFLLGMRKPSPAERDAQCAGCVQKQGEIDQSAKAILDLRAELANHYVGVAKENPNDIPAPECLELLRAVLRGAAVQ